MPELKGKIRKVDVYKIPDFVDWKRTLIVSKYGDKEVIFSAKEDERWGAYRLDTRFFLVKRNTSCIEIVTVLEGNILAHRKVYEEEAKEVYNRWSVCSLPTLCRYFGGH